MATGTAELSDSFPSEQSARRFGAHLTEQLGCKVEISRLMVNKQPTEWFRLSVPAKHVKRAEELRLTWRAALAAVQCNEYSTGVAS